MMFIRDMAAATSHEVTPEGFLRVRAWIGRAGLHDYRASEIGAPAGFAPGDIVRVYRSPEEVFHPDSMQSFAAKPVTSGHPPVMVDAANWKLYAIGQSGPEVVRDGDHLATDLLISDAEAAKRAETGAELSNGYFADFVFSKGMTPEGETYDALQRNIRGNHVALVDAGRCGPSCRIGDATVQDCTCDLEALVSDAETIVQLRQRLREVEAEHRRAMAEADGLRAATAARILDGAALDILVAERLNIVEAARRVLGASFDAAGRSVADIRRLVVVSVLGPERLRERDDAYVSAAFDTLLAARTAANPLAVHLGAGLRDAGLDRQAALAARNLHLSDAWKGDLT
jgi:hypothetical protein